MDASDMEPLNDLLDDLAGVCEHWTRNRERGRTPLAIRSALLMIAGEVANINRAASNRAAAEIGKALAGENQR